jgi:hypothetical protein
MAGNTVQVNQKKFDRLANKVNKVILAATTVDTTPGSSFSKANAQFQAQFAAPTNLYQIAEGDVLLSDDSNELSMDKDDELIDESDELPAGQSITQLQKQALVSFDESDDIVIEDDFLPPATEIAATGQQEERKLHTKIREEVNHFLFPYISNQISEEMEAERKMPFVETLKERVLQNESQADHAALIEFAKNCYIESAVRGLYLNSHVFLNNRQPGQRIELKELTLPKIDQPLQNILVLDFLDELNRALKKDFPDLPADHQALTQQVVDSIEKVELERAEDHKMRIEENKQLKQNLYRQTQFSSLRKQLNKSLSMVSIANFEKTSHYSELHLQQPAASSNRLSDDMRVVKSFARWYAKTETGPAPKMTIESIQLLREAYKQLKDEFGHVKLSPSEMVAVAEELFQELKQKEHLQAKLESKT